MTKKRPSESPAQLKTPGPFGYRTPRMIGRQAEMEWLQRCLTARGERHFVYYKAGGGLGKTRLLEELQKHIEELGEGFCTTGILDFYHTDTHSTSDIERAVVEGLDPREKYFPEYRRERARYVRLRELGADPAVLEKLRAELSKIFIRECNWMALFERKLVICFDTVELLQFESSEVEQEAGLDTVDARVKPWILTVLSQLQNVLCVFAGRPKLKVQGTEADPQARLESDMRRAFGDALRIVELPPLTADETGQFLDALPDGPRLIPPDRLPLIHRLSGGRPILLHLIVDLLRGLSPEPRRILELFDRWADLISAPEGDPKLDEARKLIETAILKNIYEECGELGGYLGRMALMPKGVDADILHDVMGLARSEADQLLDQLKGLSFIKVFAPPPTAGVHPSLKPREQVHLERVFLHDEMYRLLTRPDVMTNLRVEERALAKSLVSYYDREINSLQDQLKGYANPEERAALRERLHKLQVERLYYLLVQDPREGYREYQALTDQANRDRQVGFAMRLLDEFLRFYNTPERRQQFQMAGISHEQVVRQSAQMWVERFHWWGDYAREIEFARKVLDNPHRLHIRSDEDLAVLGNICALWARARAMRYGYEEEVVAKARSYLDRLPPVAACDRAQLLARGRLGTTIGYQYRWGGQLQEAAEVNRDAIAAFRKLGEYPEELAIVLNNQAHVHARQGRFGLAIILSDEAIEINQKMGTDYSLGLSLTNRATVERLAGNYLGAIERARKALDLFRTLEDPHGIVRAYSNMAFAYRKLGKNDLELGTPLSEVPTTLHEARQAAEHGIAQAREAGLQAELAELQAELGKVYREWGRATSMLSGHEKAVPHFRQSENLLNEALRWERLNKADRANILQDLAECHFWQGDVVGANQRISEIETLVGPELLIKYGQPLPSAEAPSQFFLPLGKVERLRGEIAFKRNNHKAGTESFLLACAYFQRYSPDAADRDATVQRLYRHIRSLPGEQQEELMKHAQRWVGGDPGLAPLVQPGLHLLQELLGF